MATIILHDILSSSNDNFLAAGAHLYNSVMPILGHNDKVVIDMEGVTAVPSVFLNVSLGRIIDEKGMDFLRSGVSFARITGGQAKRIKEYLSKYSSSAASSHA